MTDQQIILDDSDLRRYRTEIPNMADDELGPYHYRLYGHYKRVCGASPSGMCFESIRKTAQKTHMSAAQVSDTGHELAHDGWIEIHAASDVQYNLITIVDRWLENTLRFAPDADSILAKLGLSRSYGEQSSSPTVHMVNSRSHDDRSSAQTDHHMNSRSPYEQEEISVVVVDFDQNFDLENQQQQLSSLLLTDSSGAILVNGDDRLDFLIRECGLLDEDILYGDLERWVQRFGMDEVHLKVRWYLYTRSYTRQQGNQVTGGWLRTAIEHGWSESPKHFKDWMYLSPEDRGAYYVGGKYAEDIES